MSPGNRIAFFVELASWLFFLVSTISMHFIVASFAKVLQIIMIKSNHRIVDVVWSNRHLVMDDIPKSLMAPLT